MVASSFLISGVTLWLFSVRGQKAGSTAHEAIATVIATFAVAVIALYVQPYAHRMAAKLLWEYVHWRSVLLCWLWRPVY